VAAIGNRPIGVVVPDLPSDVNQTVRLQVPGHSREVCFGLLPGVDLSIEPGLGAEGLQRQELRLVIANQAFGHGEDPLRELRSVQRNQNPFHASLSFLAPEITASRGAGSTRSATPPSASPSCVPVYLGSTRNVAAIDGAWLEQVSW
jgi:hypothetical protein